MEERLVPAVLLSYGGPGSVLGLQELVSGATSSVTISEPAANQLRIDLGSNTFDASSTTKATGLTYENAGSPTTSHYAILDISQANNITTLQAALPGDSLTLEAVTNASGGLGGVTASAAVITVDGLDTSYAPAGNGDVALEATQSLTVSPNAAINTGAATITLTAGTLEFASGSTVTSSNTTADAITLRGDSVQVDTSSNPAIIGAGSFAGGPVVATLGGVSAATDLVFDGSGNLYVADPNAGAVEVFAPGATTPFYTIDGLVSPSALAFDSLGNLFVADSYANIVVGYAPFSTNPFIVLVGVDSPQAMVFDELDNLYVANTGSNLDGTTVSVFKRGLSTPSSTLTGVTGPIALDFDASGNLYVANGVTIAAAVSVFAPGATVPFRFLSAEGFTGFPVAQQFDAHGNLYVAEGASSVYVFPPGASVPSTTITGFVNPSALALDARGNLYVAEAPGTIAVVLPGSTAPTTRLSTPSLTSSALLVDPAGHLYVSGLSSVVVYGPQPTAGGVVIRAASPDQPINVGLSTDPTTGMNLSVAEFGRIFTTPNGTFTFGDLAQTGNITLGGVHSIYSGSGVDLVAIQLPTGPGAILFSTAGHDGLALSAGTGSIHLTAGTGGIFNSPIVGPASLSASGQVTLDTSGGIGSSDNPVTFLGAAPSSLTVGATVTPASGVFLGANSPLILAGIQTVNAPIVVMALADLTVMPNAIVDAGTGSILLASGLGINGNSNGSGALTIGAGAAVVSRSTGSDAITLRTHTLDIATGSVPATVGLARGVGVPPVPVAGGVVFNTVDMDWPIYVGAGGGSGLVLSPAALAQVFTTANGTLTFGNPSHTGTITFAGVTPASAPGVSIAVFQGPVADGAIVLDSTTGTALATGSGAIVLRAGPGGIVAKGGGTSLATTGPVTLDAVGGIGSSTDPLLFDSVPPSLVSVGSNAAPTGGVFLDAPTDLTLGGVATTDSALDVKATGNLTVTAGAVINTGTGTSTLAATGNLTVATGAVINTGTGTITLAAGVNPDGTPSAGGGTLALNAGAQVVSANPTASAISLRASDIAIDTSGAPVLVGAAPGTGGNAPTPLAGGVVVRTAQTDQPISLGATNAATGVVLDSAELAQIFTTDTGTLTIGDVAQTGNITFAAVARATKAGVVALQSPTGPGAILLDSTAGTALDAGQGPVRLGAGTGGIVVTGGGTSLSTTTPITLDTTGGIGSSNGRVVLSADAAIAYLTIGLTTTPGGGVYLGGLGGISLNDVRTADAPLDVTGAMFVSVTPSAVLDTGTGTIALAAGVNPDGSPATGLGVLGIGSVAGVVSRNASRDAVTLRGAALDIATGPNGAYVGALPSTFGTTPTATITGLSNPAGMALDAQGNLYVTNVTANTVSVFPVGNTAPSRTLTGLKGPASMAFDASGNLYVTNFNGTTVSVFAPGATTPTSTLTGLSMPDSIAIDAQGLIYVANLNTDTVSVFGPTDTTPFKTLSGVLVPTALAFDGFGNLYAASSDANTISVFGAGGGALLTTLTGLNTPVGMAFDAHGNLYVANTENGSVSIFAPGDTTPTTTLTGLSGPRALVLDAVGNVYVANWLGSDPASNTVSVFARGSTTPTGSLTGLNAAESLLFDPLGRLLATNAANGTVTAYSPLTPVPLAGGVTIRTNQAAQPITIGASSGDGLTVSDAELARLFAVPGGGLTLGDAGQAGGITVAGPVTRHPGYDTLSLETQGAINAVDGATLAVANLAMQAGTGIGTTGAIAIDATNLAFASQSGAIQLSDANAVTLTSVGNLPASSIPGNVFSAANLGDTYTLLHSGGGVVGQITYNGRALAEGATLTLADGNHYRISYRANGGGDVTLTRVASLTSPLPEHPSPTPVPPAAGVEPIGTTLVITGTAGNDVVRLVPRGKTLRVYASFLPAGVQFLAFKRATVKNVLMRLGDGDDLASVSPLLRLPVRIDGGAGDDQLVAGGGRGLLIGGPGRDILVAARTGPRGSILIGGSTAFDANDRALSAILAEWASSRPRSTRIGNLTGDSSSRRRLNGDAFLNAGTLVDDRARDVLLGDSRRDWFPLAPDDVAFDRNPRPYRSAPSGKLA